MSGGIHSRKGDVRTLYLIGDDGSDKSPIFQLLQLQQEELNHEINVYVKVLSVPPSSTSASIPSAPSSSIELYDFPTDRVIRPAMSLYLRMLPTASWVLYFMKQGASQKDICEWIKVLHDCEVTAKVVFISDVATYLEREKIFTRLLREFQTVMDSTFFLRLEPYAFRTALDNFTFRGINIDTANCLKPTIGRKILTFFDKAFKNLRKRKTRQNYESGGESIV